MATETAVAKLHVTIYLEADTLNKAEKTLDDLLRPYEDDDRLVAYQVTESNWTPRSWAEAGGL